MTGWMTPPTFVTATPAASTDLNIIRDDLIDLDERTTPYFAEDTTTRTTTSTSYVTLGIASVAAPIGANGLATVNIYSSFQGDTIGALVLISYKITGAATYGPNDSDSVTYQVANVLYSARYGAQAIASIGAVAPGSARRSCTFTMMFKVSSGIGSFQNSRIIVTPGGS
jgi:hypothetical protein